MLCLGVFGFLRRFVLFLCCLWLYSPLVFFLLSRGEGEPHAKLALQLALCPSLVWWCLLLCLLLLVSGRVLSSVLLLVLVLVLALVLVFGLGIVSASGWSWVIFHAGLGHDFDLGLRLGWGVFC